VVGRKIPKTGGEDGLPGVEERSPRFEGSNREGVIFIQARNRGKKML